MQTIPVATQSQASADTSTQAGPRQLRLVPSDADIRRALEQHELTATEHLLLQYVCALSLQEGYCWASQEHLAKLARCCVRTLRDVVAALCGRGLLETTRSREGLRYLPQWAALGLAIDPLRTRKRRPASPAVPDRQSLPVLPDQQSDQRSQAAAAAAAPMRDNPQRPAAGPHGGGTVNAAARASPRQGAVRSCRPPTLTPEDARSLLAMPEGLEALKLLESNRLAPDESAWAIAKVRSYQPESAVRLLAVILRDDLEPYRTRRAEGLHRPPDKPAPAFVRPRAAPRAPPEIVVEPRHGVSEESRQRFARYVS